MMMKTQSGDPNRLQNVSRIKRIQEWMPEAMEKRQNSDCQSTMAFADLFRRALSQGVIII
jgi:hypothetical protein